MLVGELADLTHVSPRSLRHYDRSGLLHSHRSSNDYRTFDADAVRQVRRIRRLLDLGFTVREIRELVTCFGQDDELEACAVLRNALAQREQAAGAEINRLNSYRDKVARTLARIDAGTDPAPARGA